MSKFIIGTIMSAVTLLAMVSCGGGNAGEVNTDTVISKELGDTLSRNLGAFMGSIRQDEISPSGNIQEYIEGYQLIAGHKYSPEQLMGMRSALYLADQFAAMEADGIPLNRDLFMQEFRKYIQMDKISATEQAELYNRLEGLMQQIDEIMTKRDALRRGEPAAEEAAAEIPAVSDSVEVVEEVALEVSATTGSETEGKTGSNAGLDLEMEYGSTSL